MKLNLTIIAAALALAACGGGGSSEPVPTPPTPAPTPTPTVAAADFAGMWAGTLETDNLTMLVRADGKVWQLSSRPGQVHNTVSVGQLTYSGGAVQVAGTNWISDGNSPPIRFESTMTGTPKGGLSGLWTPMGIGNAGSLKAIAAYDTFANTAPMTIASAVGSYAGYVSSNAGAVTNLTASVAADGSISALLSNGCKVTGQLAASKPPGLDVTLTTGATCAGGAVTHTGVAIVNAEKGGLVMAIATLDLKQGSLVALAKAK